MSWHCRVDAIGETPGTMAGPVGAIVRSTIDCRFVRRVAVSAAVGVPVPPRARTMLSSWVRTKLAPNRMSWPVTGLRATNPPVRRAVSSARRAFAISSSAAPWTAGALRPVKMLARFTTSARSGLATGTLMISMRHSEEFGSSGAARLQPGSSLGDRTLEDPET